MFSNKWVSTAKSKIWLWSTTLEITSLATSMSSIAMKNTLKMLWTTLMEGSSMEKKLVLSSLLWLISSMPNASNTLMEAAKEEVTAITCTWNLYQKALRKNSSRICTSSILSTESRRDQKVPILLKKGGDKKEERKRKKSTKSQRTEKDLILSTKSRSTRSTKINQDPGQEIDLQIGTVLRKEGRSSTSGMKSSTSDWLWLKLCQITLMLSFISLNFVPWIVLICHLCMLYHWIR